MKALFELETQQKKINQKEESVLPPQNKGTDTKYSFEDAVHFKNVLMQLICKGET